MFVNIKFLKLIILLILTNVLLSCKSTGQTLSIEELGVIPKNGAYYKDNEQLFNNFIGTWLYTNGSTSLKFVLKKVTKNRVYFTEDLLVGEYQYIENGFEKINTLNNINAPENNIEGNTVIYFDSKPRCNDCTAIEKRLGMTFNDPIKETAGALYFRKVMVGGQEAISAWFLCDGIKYIGGPDIVDTNPIYVGETVPNGVYVLIKQP